MSKKTRIAIFSILSALFLIIAPMAVMYSFGWRFDWQTKKIIQPGMMYFRTAPKGSQIYVDGEAKKRTDVLFGSALIENIMPGTYEVEIRREGYHSWIKNLQVFKRQVTSAENVTLIPQNLNISSLSENVADFFFSPDKKKIILKEINESGEWSLKLIDAQKSIKSHLLSRQDLKLGALTPKSSAEIGNADLINLEFSQDSKRILLAVGAKEKIYYFVLSIDNKKLVSFEFLEQSPEKIFFSPDSQANLLVMSEKEIREADPVKKELSPALIKNVITAATSGGNIYYIDEEGFIFKTNASGSGKERINIIPFRIEQETEYELSTVNNRILLRENSALYIFDQDKASFEKLLEPSKEFTASRNPDKIAYYNEHEIWIMFLGRKYEQPAKGPGDKVFINRFSENIGDVFWYTDHYIIFSLGDKIKVAEIDDRDKINIIDVAEFKSPKIFFADKKLYILSENTLHASSELIP